MLQTFVEKNINMTLMTIIMWYQLSNMKYSPLDITPTLRQEQHSSIQNIDFLRLKFHDTSVLG